MTGQSSDSTQGTRVWPGTWRISGIQAGVAMAVLAVLASAIIGDRADEAYGICMACHGRDLLNWLLNSQLNTKLPVAPAFLIFPALTTVGVLVGALVSAITRGEFRWQRPENPFLSFLLGVLVMNCALIAGGCATRLLLRAATGETLELAAYGAMVSGVILATYLLRWWAQR